MRLTGFLCCLVLCGFAALAAAATSANPQSPLARQTFTVNGEAVLDVGRVGLNITNFGLIGSKPGTSAPYSQAPSLEYPLGSGVQNLWGAGVWVGGIIDGVPHVSTGQYEMEFLADPNDPVDTVYESHEGQRADLACGEPLMTITITRSTKIRSTASTTTATGRSMRTTLPSGSSTSTHRCGTTGRRSRRRIPIITPWVSASVRKASPGAIRVSTI